MSSRHLNKTASVALDFERATVGKALLVHADCLEWMARAPEASVHAIVTDPPYGVREYDRDQLDKRSNGRGGVWRIPPAFDGNVRAPLPRFTALDARERRRIADFFREWASLAVRGASTARGRRIAERGAIYSTLERFELIRRTRGGAPLEDVKRDG